MSEASGKSCDGMEFSKDGQLRPEAEDRMRLQVAASGGTGNLLLGGGKSLRPRCSVFEMIPAGPDKLLEAFGAALVDIFENPGTRYTFAGRRSEGARDIFEYAFVVPIDASHSRVRAGNE